MLRDCKFNCGIVNFVLFSYKDKSTFVRFLTGIEAKTHFHERKDTLSDDE